MKKVSIIVPCYNEESNIQSLQESITRLMQQESTYEWEIMLIDDGSSDQTLTNIKAVRAQDRRFSYIALSRNFGKEQAMLAGFDHVTGDCAIVMDADLQHPVDIIPQMIAIWEQGYDDVYGKRDSRGKESLVRRILTLAYYRFLQRVANVDILPNVGDFRLLDRKCVDALRQLRESQRYTKALYGWIGFKKKEIRFNQESRHGGTSSFNYRKLFGLAIEGITTYTTAPLRISTILGLLVSLFAFIYMCYVFFKTIIVGEPVQGFPTLIIVLLFLGGVQLISLGIIGEYLGRIFHETKHRPSYFIQEKEGMDE
ncbi:MAG: glycosyltransferase family 2 protein [Prevotella sp.]|nr:glycosyltransferase family 2 protein [Prevotella sp.]MDD4533200.1 glycosyltransferase family 2 protein [Prevotella sp.]